MQITVNFTTVRPPPTRHYQNTPMVCNYIVQVKKWHADFKN